MTKWGEKADSSDTPEHTKKQLKCAAATHTLAVNKVSGECGRYSKCTTRIRKAEEKIKTAMIEAKASEITLQYLEKDVPPN